MSRENPWSHEDKEVQLLLNMTRISCISAPNSYKLGSNNRLDFCTSKLDILHDLIVIHRRIINDVIQGYDTNTRVHYYVVVIKTYPIVECE